MAQLNRLAYGFFEDGLIFKLAVLTKEGDNIQLRSLEQVEMESSLYEKPPEVKGDKIHQGDNWQSEEKSTQDINLDDFSSESVATFQILPYERLLRSYPLQQGIIAINVNDDRLIKHPITDADIKNKQKKVIVKELLTPEEYKSREWQYSVVAINNLPELWIHNGSNRLFDIIENYRKSSGNNFYYKLSDANDIALANLYQLNTPADSDQVCMVLYLGQDYKRVLMFEGQKWIASLPIHVGVKDVEIESIYSKISLTMEEAHITEPPNLLLCGDLCNEDNIYFLQNQLPNTAVKVWEFPNLGFDAEATIKYGAYQVSRFVLPIALAWKALMYDNPIIIRSNFLTSSVIEGQKVFKIAWHGFFVMAMLFGISLFFTIKFLDLNFNIQMHQSQNALLKVEYNKKKAEAEYLITMQKAMETQSKSLETIRSILSGKNPWTEVITLLNNSFSSHPVSWLENVKKDGNGFQIVGITTERKNVVVFSELFPNGKIVRVSQKQIRNKEVWQFEISFSFPEVNWVDIMAKDAVQLERFEHQREATSTQLQAEAKTKKAKSQKTKKVMFPRIQASKSFSIDLPQPPPLLIENKADPAVKAYFSVIQAYNENKNWLMIEQGIKFLNNYPAHKLNQYIRVYISYRSLQMKEHQRSFEWLQPVLKQKETLYPYALLISGLVFNDLDNREQAELLWNEVASEYPLHPMAKTANSLLKLNGK